MTISKPLYVYLQRPDTGTWVTVGRYTLRWVHARALSLYTELQESTQLALHGPLIP